MDYLIQTLQKQIDDAKANQKRINKKTISAKSFDDLNSESIESIFKWRFKLMMNDFRKKLKKKKNKNSMKIERLEYKELKHRNRICRHQDILINLFSKDKNGLGKKTRDKMFKIVKDNYERKNTKTKDVECLEFREYESKGWSFRSQDEYERCGWSDYYLLG